MSLEHDCALAYVRASASEDSFDGADPLSCVIIVRICSCR